MTIWLERWIAYPDDEESREEGGLPPIEESDPDVAVPAYVEEFNALITD